MGFFFKNKKKNKTEEILAQITEAVTEDEILEKLKTTTDVDYILKTFANME